MSLLTVAICSFNRSQNLPRLISALRQQTCSIPFEIFVVDNNSSDDTQQVLAELSKLDGAALRYCIEQEQGIVHARNRVLKESIDSDYLLFIDDDELPGESLLEAATQALAIEHADCVGGAIDVEVNENTPPWLSEELMGFLGRLNYGDKPFWISDHSTPIWSGNIAYNMKLFRQDPSLSFDIRYNRVGKGVGGGEDAAMFWKLIDKQTKIRYRPDMLVIHLVEPWRLKRRYFLKLHYLAGLRQGQHKLPDYPKAILGVPPFLVSQFIRQCVKTLTTMLFHRPNLIRQCMNTTHAWGSIIGYAKRKHVNKG